MGQVRPVELAKLKFFAYLNPDFHTPSSNNHCIPHLYQTVVDSVTISAALTIQWWACLLPAGCQPNSSSPEAS